MFTIVVPPPPFVIVQLVLRIKSVANETKLLVVDPETDTYYQQRNINVDGKQSNVEYVRNPATPPGRRHSSSTTSQSSDDGGDDQRRVQLNNQQNGTNRRSQISQHSNSTAQVTHHFFFFAIQSFPIASFSFPLTFSITCQVSFRQPKEKTDGSHYH